MNLVMTILGFAMSATFVMFVCARLLCVRIRQRHSRSRSSLDPTPDDVSECRGAWPLSSPPPVALLASSLARLAVKCKLLASDLAAGPWTGSVCVCVSNLFLCWLAGCRNWWCNWCSSSWSGPSMAWTRRSWPPSPLSSTVKECSPPRTMQCKTPSSAAPRKLLECLHCLSDETTVVVLRR